MIIVIAILAVLVYATITDLRTREVPDWLSYLSMALGAGFAIIRAYQNSDITIIWTMLAAMAAAALIGFFMYYAGQWGGGDAKLIIGLGALIGLDLQSLATFPPLGLFLINTIIAGAIYGIIWALVMLAKHREGVKAHYHQELQKRKQLRIIVLCAVGVLAVGSVIINMLVIRLLLLLLAAVIFMLFYAWLLVRSVEAICMIKEVPVSKLTEGDWIVGEIKAKGKILASAKDLGITKQQIALLQKHGIRTVTIKEGVPFVPSFLIGYLMTLTLGIWFL